MKLKIAQTIEWDDALPLEEQSFLTQAWFTENVSRKLTIYDDQQGVKLKKDHYGRPELWLVDLPDFTVEVKWNFQKKESADWTKGRDTVTIKPK